MAGRGRTTLLNGLRAIFMLAVATVHLAGCGDEGESKARPRAPLRSDVENPPAPPQANADIHAPALPDCLLGDAEGCAAPPSLPACLQDGCASPPIINDWTCPNDWVVESIELPTQTELAVCQAPEAIPCSVGEAAFAGQTTCSTIGPDCPSSLFPTADELRSSANGFAGSIVYVAAGGSGNGTLAAPFGSISEALATASDGDIIALGAGTFEESILVDRRVAIVGRCVASSTLSPSDADAPTVRLSAHGALLSRVRILGAQTGLTIDGAPAATVHDVEVLGAREAAVRVMAGGEFAIERVALRPTAGPSESPAEGVGLSILEGKVTLHDAVIEGSRNAGVLVDGPSSSLDAKRTIVANTLSRLDDGDAGVGVSVSAQASASLVESLVVNNHGAGLLVVGASLTMSDVSVHDTQGLDSDNRGGHGIMALDGAHVLATRAVIDGNRTSGVLAFGASTIVELASVVVRNTKSQASDKTAGRGLEAWSGAHLIAKEAWIHHNRAMGLVAIQPGSTLEVFDSFITETESEEGSGLFGRGFWVTGAGTGKATRTWFVDNRSIGAGVVKTGSALELSDVEIRGTRPRALDDEYGRGIEVWGGASLQVVRASLRDNHAIGIFTSDAGTEVSLDQTLIEGTLPRASDSTGGYGLVAWDGVTLDVRQSVLNENHAVGLYVANAGTQVTMQDVAVRSTKAEVDNGSWGAGWIFSEGCAVSGERLEASGNRTVGFLATDPDTVVALSDVSVRETREPAGDATIAPGYGIAAMAGSALTLSRANVSRNGTAGVVVGTDASLEVDALFVRDTQSDAGNFEGGEGLVATPASTVIVRRSLFAANRSTAVAAYGSGTTVTLEDVVLRDTLPPACGQLPFDDPFVCAMQGVTWAPSAGLWADGGASVVISRFEASGSACGLWAGPDGWLDASHGTIHDNAIGVNVRNPGLDLDSVRGPTLRYVDNDTNLDDVEMGIPDVSNIELPSSW